MSSTSASDPKDSNHHEAQPALPLWRRKIRGMRLPVLPVHNSEGNRDLSVTTSKGNIYLLDQFREKVPLPIRNRSIAMLSEFVGTFLFMLIGLGGNSTIINDPAMELQYEGGEASADPAKVLVIAVVWGVAVTVNAWTFFRISGGLFNPAVTMALMMVRAVEPLDGFLDVFSQLVGSILASTIAYGLLPPGSLAAVKLGDSTSVSQGLFIEMFITAQVVLSVFMLATEKHKATFIAPVGIGLAVFACVLFATTYTGAGINPARAFAVCVVLGSFPSYHWIYWLGPALGALLATAFYQLIRKLEYWTVNPDVDDYETKVGETIRDVAGRVADVTNKPDSRHATTNDADLQQQATNMSLRRTTGSGMGLGKEDTQTSSASKGQESSGAELRRKMKSRAESKREDT